MHVVRYAESTYSCSDGNHDGKIQFMLDVSMTTFNGTRDPKEVFFTSLDTDATNRMHYGINVSDTCKYLKYIKAQNRSIGKKIIYTFERIRGMKSPTPKNPTKTWTVKCLLPTVLERSGIYIHRQEVTVIFDGSTSVDEVLTVILRYTTPEFNIVQELAHLGKYEKLKNHEQVFLDFFFI